MSEYKRCSLRREFRSLYCGDVKPCRVFKGVHYVVESSDCSVSKRCSLRGGVCALRCGGAQGFGMCGGVHYVDPIPPIPHFGAAVFIHTLQPEYFKILDLPYIP